MSGICFVQPLSGCTVGYEKPDPALDIPAYYREAGRGAPHAAVPAIDWWRGFRSNELTALIEEALIANLDIAAAVARVLQADAQARIAGAPLLPVANLNASGTRSRPSQTTGPDGGITGERGSSERTLYSGSLSASYEIDFWGKNRATVLAAEEIAVATRFAREVVALTTQASVANTYFAVLGAQDRLRIARDNVRAATRILTLIRERVAAGTASELDTAQQESIVAAQRATIPLFVQLVRQNIATLAQLIGRAPEFVSVKGGSMSRIAIPRVTPGLPSELLIQRPDIRDAEAQLAAGNANVEAARAAFFPSIQLTGEGGYQSAALKMLFNPASAFFQLAAGLTQPILDGFRLRGLLEQAQGRQEELLQLYRGAVVAAFADVDRALIAVQETARREELQRQAVASARRAFEISETRLREGTIDLITVLNTQQTFFQAEDVLVQARLLRLQAVVGLFQALGGGWAMLSPQARLTNEAVTPLNIDAKFKRPR
jgi:NodT family efflux transporter outer membrane factor (OMF) lipoprotein